MKDEKIVKVNPAARALMVESGTDIRNLILTGQEEYDTFSDGCLCLTLSLSGMAVNAAVTRMGNYHVCILDQDTDDAVFNAMALIATELRKPLDSVMRLTDQLLEAQEDSLRDQTTRLNQGLYQMLRIVSNLSYPAAGVSSQEVRDVGGIVDEIMEKAQTLLSGRPLSLTYEGLPKAVYCLVDSTLLERSLLNLLSNAVKFTPDNGRIHVSFSLRGRTLQLRVQDSGSGIAEQVKGSLFYRYLRQPTIEDSRYGLGLGMVMVRTCAAKHGGVVLADTSEDGGSRITMTMAIRQNPTDRLHSPLNLWTDYTGGRDHALVELSDCLEYKFYDTVN